MVADVQEQLATLARHLQSKVKTELVTIYQTALCHNLCFRENLQSHGVL
jgi:hypothetical protein